MESDKATPLNSSGKSLLGSYLIVMPIFLTYIVYSIWPRAVPADVDKTFPVRVNLFHVIKLDLDPEMRYILIVLIVGALGSFIHTATSYADYAGNRRLVSSWVWWYLLRPFIGSVLALIVYFAIRGGFFSTGGQETENVNIFGIAGIAGLVGMFSKQATDKLNELFTTLFQTNDARIRGDQMNRPAPSISAITPTLVEAGSADGSDIEVIGSSFVETSVVLCNDITCDTTFVDASHLKAALPKSELAKVGTLNVVVVTPPPGGGRTAGLKLNVVSSAELNGSRPAETNGHTDPEASDPQEGEPADVTEISGDIATGAPVETGISSGPQEPVPNGDPQPGPGTPL
jgi:hypothetical protein